MKRFFIVVLSITALLGSFQSFAQSANVTEEKQSAAVVATVTPPSQATVPVIPALPRKLKGRWENPTTGNVLEVTIKSIDGTKITGLLTFWGSKGSFECMQLIDAPMEGTWDGETFQVVARAHDYETTKCEKSFTMKIGSGKHFLWSDDGAKRIRYLDPF